MSSFPASPEDASQCTPVLNQSLTAKRRSKTRVKNGAIGPQENLCAFSCRWRPTPSGSGLHPILRMSLCMWVAGELFFLSFFFFLLWKWKVIFCPALFSFGFEKEGHALQGIETLGHVCPDNVLGEHGFRAGFESKIYHLLTWGALGMSLAFLSHAFSSIELIITNLTRSFLSKIKIDHGCKVFCIVLRRKPSPIKDGFRYYIITLLFLCYSSNLPDS